MCVLEREREREREREKESKEFHNSYFLGVLIRLILTAISFSLSLPPELIAFTLFALIVETLNNPASMLFHSCVHRLCVLKLCEDWGRKGRGWVQQEGNGRSAVSNLTTGWVMLFINRGLKTIQNQLKVGPWSRWWRHRREIRVELYATHLIEYRMLIADCRKKIMQD